MEATKNNLIKEGSKKEEILIICVVIGAIVLGLSIVVGIGLYSNSIGKQYASAIAKDKPNYNKLNASSLCLTKIRNDKLNLERSETAIGLIRNSCIEQLVK